MKGFSRRNQSIFALSFKNYFTKKPLNVTITGACGNLGYAAAFRIAAGDMLGPDQPVNLNLVDIHEVESKLKGVKLEIDDCSFPLVNKINICTELSIGFKDCDYALLIGIKNTISSGERRDGLRLNAPILMDDGKAINDNANPNCKVLVLGNPVNTNCLLAMAYAPRLKRENFHSMSRLDHNRAVRQVAELFKVNPLEVEQVAVWGNHDETMFADLQFAKVKGESIFTKVNQDFLKTEFPSIVANRWKEVLRLRGLTSCASASNAGIDHVRDWHFGTEGKWVSSGIYSEGTHYDIPKGIIFSVPTTMKNGHTSIVSGLKLCDLTKEKIKITAKSLIEEREMIDKYLPGDFKI